MKNQRVYLSHIVECIEDIKRYTALGRETFFENRMQQDAVIRRLEVIGEAAKHLSKDVKDRRPDLAWREISRIADKMLHEYLGVNLEMVWALVERDLPALKQGIDDLLQRGGGFSGLDKNR